MSVDAFRLFKLASEGFCCSQIIMILGLEEMGKEDSDLIRAMTGLCGGMGRSGKTCGALTSAVCLLGLHAGKGKAEEVVNSQINHMINELLEWFEEANGSIECSEIIDTSLDSNSEYPVKCGSIVTDTFNKVQEILARYEDEVEMEEDL